MTSLILLKNEYIPRASKPSANMKKALLKVFAQCRNTAATFTINLCTNAFVEFRIQKISLMNIEYTYIEICFLQFILHEMHACLVPGETSEITIVLVWYALPYTCCLLGTRK